MGLFNILFGKPKPKITVKTNMPFNDEDYRKYALIQEKVYGSPLYREHYKNIEKIEMQYSVLHNLRAYYSPEMDGLIELCKQDIAILEPIKALHKQYGAEFVNCNWVSFKRLAIIYERRKEYDKAIEVCRQAIASDMLHDGSKGQMPGRLARLLRISGKLPQDKNSTEITQIYEEETQ